MLANEHRPPKGPRTSPTAGSCTIMCHIDPTPFSHNQENTRKLSVGLLTNEACTRKSHSLSHIPTTYLLIQSSHRPRWVPVRAPPLVSSSSTAVDPVSSSRLVQAPIGLSRTPMGACASTPPLPPSITPIDQVSSSRHQEVCDDSQVCDLLSVPFNLL